jgi:ABC-type amino acid transport substrate-binding protein
MAWQGPADEFFGICMKKGNTELVDAVNKALDELFADGTMKKISENNFGTDIVSSVRK